MNDVLTALGRLGLSLMFIVLGWGKIAGYAGTQQYMESAGIPGALLPVTIAVEVGGGLAILLGLYTRCVALVLAVFTLATAAIFHLPHFSDMSQAINVWKNISIAGGMLVLAAHGAGAYSIDARRSR